MDRIMLVKMENLFSKMVKHRELIINFRLIVTYYYYIYYHIYDYIFSRAQIEIEIINDDEYEKEEDFYVELSAPRWETDLGPGENGADGSPVLGSHTRCKVVIIEDKEFKVSFIFNITLNLDFQGFVDKIVANANISLMVGTSSWKQQFAEALEVEDIDGDGSLSPKEKILHYVALPWKLTFALIPPTDYFNGKILNFILRDNCLYF